MNFNTRNQILGRYHARGQLFDQVAAKCNPHFVEPPARRAPIARAGDALSKREQQVLSHLADGLANSEIGRALSSGARRVPDAFRTCGPDLTTDIVPVT